MSHAQDNAVSIGGYAMAVGGGLIAQVTPTTNVGAAGLIMSVSGLLVAGFQYYKAYLESKQYAQRIAVLEASRAKWHKERSDFQGVLSKLEVELEEEKLLRARLEGKLGIADKTHVEAINTNIDNIKAVAERLDPPVQVSVPHLEPVASDLIPEHFEDGYEDFGPLPSR